MRTVLGLLIGIIVGAAVNGGLVAIGPSLIPAPAGVDMNDMESLRKAMPLFEPRHFVVPFLAHALGTLLGALSGYSIALRRKPSVAYAIGALFLCGGIAASVMLPAPAWFIALDLVAAYIPMAWLAVRIGARTGGRNIRPPGP